MPGRNLTALQREAQTEDRETTPEAIVTPTTVARVPNCVARDTILPLRGRIERVLQEGGVTQRVPLPTRSGTALLLRRRRALNGDRETTGTVGGARTPLVLTLESDPLMP